MTAKQAASLAFATPRNEIKTNSSLEYPGSDWSVEALLVKISERPVTFQAAQ
jgi:hypothetical protein